MTYARVRSVFTVSCTADVAWRAAHSPAVASALYRPVFHMRPDSGALPTHFSSGDHIDVHLRFFNLLPVGRQRISIEDTTHAQLPLGSRTMRDCGGPLSGILTLTRTWNHEISVWPQGDKRAVWHDELTLSGPFARVLSWGLRPLWLWRKLKIRRLAVGWSATESAH